MKDQLQKSASIPGSEKKEKIKPAVPPRRNAPPLDGLTTKSAALSSSSKRVATGKVGLRDCDSVLIGKDNSGSLIRSPGNEFLSRAFSDKNCGSSTPLPPEGNSEKVRLGGDNPLKPSVKFDPNPTILHSGSDGSPMKVSAKDGAKRLAVGGGENAAGTGTAGETQIPLSSALKRTTDDLHANLEAAARAKPEEPEDCHLRELYTQVSEVVAAKPDEFENINEDEAEDPSAVPMIWISKWVDYSDKYGLGYQLSDDSIGVLFNDFTKLILLPDGENIHYIERNGQEHYHQLRDFPDTLYKKVTLLKYFRNYMNEHLLKAGASMSPREGDELARIPSLKTFFRTRSAIILHLTNGTLQINFFEDHTKVILCPLMGAVTYIDKKRNFRTFRLEMLQKFGCSNDLGNRLRYGRNMIQKLLSSKSGSSNKGASVIAPSSLQPAQSKQAVP